MRKTDILCVGLQHTKGDKMYNYIENIMDYKTYFSLRESVGWNNYSEVQAKEAIQKSIYTVAAQENGENIGMARLIGDGIYYIVADVIVKPEYQGHGIGTCMIDMICSYVEERLPKDGRVSIFLVSVAGKEMFYERFGFKKIPHEFCGCGMRKVIYGKG